MEIVPITKESLRGLYAATQEEARQKKISEIVHGIYGRILATSKSSAVTVYKHDCKSLKTHSGMEVERCIGCDQHHSMRGRPVYHIHTLDPFYEANMEDILARLRLIFPDSSVQYKRITTGADGTVVNLSTLDPSLRSLIKIAEDVHYIVIDWS
jgi:hypothetical protein